MPDLPVVGVFGRAFEQAALVDAVFEFFERDLEMLARDLILEPDAGFLFDELLQLAVQPFGVHGIERVLHDLQPVAGHLGVADMANRTLGHEAVPARQQRRRLRTEVGEDHAAERFDRIAAGRHLVFERTAVGLVRLIDARARAVELPAVIRAADAVRLRDAVGQRRAPVRAELVDQSELAGAIAKEHEIFAEQPDALGVARLSVLRPQRSGASSGVEVRPSASRGRRGSTVRFQAQTA